MEKVKTYINKNNFQFITDFSKYQYTDTKGNTHELDFGKLTIAQRVILSAYLTLLTNGNEYNKKNIFDIIFDFNNHRDKNNLPAFYEKFISDLTKLLNSPYYFAFIKTHLNDIEENKTKIYRQQLNHSEMELLYDIKTKNDYNILINVLYILGVSKQNISTAKLNKIYVNEIYRNKTFAVKKIESIFKKINQVSKNKIKYKIINNILIFSKGYNVPEKEEYSSDDYKEYLLNEEIDRQLKLFDEEIDNCKENEEAKVEAVEVVKEAENIKEAEVKDEDDEVENIKSLISKKSTSSNIEAFTYNTDEKNINVEMCKEYAETELFSQVENLITINNFANKLGIEKYIREINNIIHRIIYCKSQDVIKIWKESKKEDYDINKIFISDKNNKNGLARKKSIVDNICKLRDEILLILNDLHDKDKTKFIIVLTYFLSKYSNILKFTEM